jgi:hypothetical protein
MHHRFLSIPLTALLAAGVCAAPALAGTDGDDNATPAPAIQPAPATVPVVPAPAPSTVVKDTSRHHSAQRSTSHAVAHRGVQHRQTRLTTARTSGVVHAVAATATPTGGVQAGEGGMAQHGSNSALLGVGAGLAAFGIAAGVHARRRRAFER